MPVFDQLPRASFDGLEFPIEECEVKCALRHHVHLYPHSPGGALEKLGRELYRITMRGNFQTRFPKWGDNLWPGTLAGIRDRFENEVTSDLVIPTIGTIKACLVDFTQVQTAKIRSGEKANFTFIEDQSSAFLVNGLINVKVDMPATADSIVALSDEAPPAFGDFFDTIVGMIDSVTALGDQVELYGSLMSSKLQGIADACAALEDRFAIFDDPEHHELLYAVHDLRSAAITQREDVLRKSVPLITFTTPIVMSVTDISNRLYGVSDRATEILQLNALEDAFRIPVNTNVRAYAS
jgi:prophage DNA circulation protein